DTSDSDASPGPTTRVKAEKSRTQNGSSGKGKGKARAETDEPEERSPRGAKRARVDEQGGAVPRDEDGEDEDEDEEDEEPVKRVKTLPRDVDGFIPGSIVRIQLRNFVTYDAVSFRPGPFLNMILGPNGTGKSSIACAICLGLNFPASTLGRASDVGSFVKLGTQAGSIEIELKGEQGGRNVVVKRTIGLKSSSFTVDGAPASGREVSARVAKLGVQVGNLCSFLPQDKVSAFAAMSPTELLRETQRAAGDARLEAWHQTLISEGKGLKGIQDSIKAESATVQQLIERNESIERDVQRYRDRKKIEHAIALLRVLIPVQAYREARAQFIALKARQRAQHLRVTTLREKNAPAHALLGKLDTQHDELHHEREDAKKRLRIALGRVEKKSAASEALGDETEDLQSKLQGLKRAEKARLATIKNCEAAIEKLREDIDEAKEMEVEEEVRAEGRRLTAEHSASPLEREKRAWEQRNGELGARRNQNARNEEGGRRELKALGDADAVKLQNLTRWNQDVGDAVRWLRQNRDKFKMEVFEPPALSVRVPKKEYAAAVENSFNGSQMQMFVCQCKEDYDTLNDCINDRPGLGRKAKVPTWFRPGTDADLVGPPMAREELAARGFDGYAIEYVQCPEGMRWFLQRELNMHRTAVSLRGIKDLQGAIDAVGRPGPSGRTTNTNFIDQRTVHQVQRSRYGRRELMASANHVGDARNFGGPAQGTHAAFSTSNAGTVNPAEKQRIDDILARCKQEAAEIQEEERALSVDRKRLDAIEKEQKAAMMAVKKRLQVIIDETKRRAGLEGKLKKAEQQLVAAQNKGDAVQRGARYRAQIMEIAKRRVKLVAEAVDLARDVIDEQVQATTLGLQYLQIGAKKAALKELCDRKDAKYQAALAEFNKIDAEFEKTKESTRTLLAESKELLSALPDELREEYQAAEAARLAHEKAVQAAEKAGEEAPEPGEDVDLRSMEELETELEKQEANLEMNMNTNPGVVEQYEKRKRDIEALEVAIEGKQRQADKIEKKIKTARENWQPALQSLVTSIGKKFSAAFDRIGCAGEIRVREEEAYENWAIDILVKFRDTEKLQLLTGQRQSGGERSLTTILYLMSLTEEARAPFSLVDEINQGMDQRAERMVHNSMVDVTCKEDSVQYFLITPKLLPDLEYHRRMKVLCVNNGEWLPDESGLGNMMAMINGFV
ncbi:P-loop containing nucleoside triphosphate hydrolase protein, partial [Mycena maculata]